MKRFIVLTALAVSLLTACSSHNSLTVVSYNVCVFHRHPESMSLISEMAKSVDANALFLCEVDSCCARTGYVDQADVFAREMGEWKYNFSKTIPLGDGSYGICSMVSPQTIVKKQYSITLPKYVGGEQRALSIIETADYVLAGTHLDHKKTIARPLQAKMVRDTLVSLYGESRMPVILCGDFNDTPDGRAIKVLSEKFTIISGEEPTWPNDNPEKCIDYIMILRNKASVSVQKSGILDADGSDLASDHLPVFAKLRW